MLLRKASPLFLVTAAVPEKTPRILPSSLRDNAITLRVQRVLAIFS
jgi:hypothetical protein